MQNKLVVRRYS